MKFVRNPARKPNPAMDRVNPLTDAQFAELEDYVDADDTCRPVRFMIDGRAVNIATGILSTKGSNILYHPVYWDRSPAWVDKVVGFLVENNPGMFVRVSYH